MVCTGVTELIPILTYLLFGLRPFFIFIIIFAQSFPQSYSKLNFPEFIHYKHHPMKQNICFYVLLFVNLLILSNHTYAGHIKNHYTHESETQITTYNYPRIAPVSKDFTLRANGKEIFVYQTSAGPFAAFSCDGAVTIEIEVRRNVSDDIHISPISRGIVHSINGNTISFEIPGPMLLCLMEDLMPQLYIYANPPENNPPDATDPNVFYYKAGQVYEVGDMELKSNQTLFIEGGAIVRGALHASSAENIRIAGYGILDGSYFTDNDKRRSILLEGCKNSLIEDIIMIEPTSWMILLGLSDSITVRNIKQLGSVTTTDGIDVVGSRHIRIENSFLRNGDDCVAIKSFDIGRYEKKATMNFSRDVYDVEVNGCIMISFLGGHAFEIGHELTTESIRDIRFRNCDVLGIHGHGGVFGINNCDRAVVSDILYENIRVEHYYNKLVNLRVIKSRYHRDEERGHIRNIRFKNIYITNSKFNPGYSTSVIGGYDAEHLVDDVVFENFRINNVKVTNGDQMDLFVKQAKGIKFK
jgi:hypothetical protein